MLFKNLELEDKSLFKGFDYICSDYLFSYLFMYGDSYNIKIYHDDRALIIYSGGVKPSFYMPLGDIMYGIGLVTEYCSMNNIKPIFSKITAKYTGLFEERNYRTEEDRNSFDYIFKNSDLANYRGKRYRNQRNNLANFLKVCSPVYSNDIENHIDECMDFMLSHFDGRTEIINPTTKILGNLKNLGCSGGLLYCGSKLKAFCIYEKVSPDSVVSHVELSDNNYRGTHASLIREMSQRIPEDYINKEDDMGLPGLRRFKMSYNPCDMIKKYIAYPEG